MRSIGHAPGPLGGAAQSAAHRISVPVPAVKGPQRWDLLLVCVAVYIATAVGRIHQLFPALLSLKPALISAAVATGLYAIAQSGLRRVELLRNRVSGLLLALTVWMALSVPGALNVGAAFQFWTDNFLKTVLMYVVIAGSIRSFRDVERLALVYFGATVAYAAVVLARFQVNQSSWRLAGLYSYDANDFATLAVTAMPIGLYLIWGGRSPLLRAGATGGLGALVVGVVRSGSRGGLLALLVTSCFVLVGFTTVPKRWRLSGLTIVLLLVAATGSDRYWMQMQTIVHPSADYNETSETGRIQTWRRGLVYMADHPVFGVGANNFWFAEGTISPLAERQKYGRAVRWGAAHTSFVQVGAELGVPGLLLFIGIVGSTFACLRRVARDGTWTDSASGQRPLAHSLMAALVAFLVGAFFLSLAYTEMLYTLVAIAVGLAKATRVRAIAPSRAVWR
jgi:O-antigen ligase